MKYGYFDESKKEYVITRPDTPAPWVNYLGSPEYGAIVSNNAGGYSFAKSGANGRLLRYVFNQFDEPGRYIYIRDNGSKDYWSASWYLTPSTYHVIFPGSQSQVYMWKSSEKSAPSVIVYVPCDCE